MLIAMLALLINWIGNTVRLHNREWEKMDDGAKNVDNDIVIIVENEAESLPAVDDKLKLQGGIGFGLMDTCPICKLSFHNREPKLLPCLHSFCKRCLPAPFRTNEPPRRDPHGPGDSNKPPEKSGVNQDIQTHSSYTWWRHTGIKLQNYCCTHPRLKAIKNEIKHTHKINKIKRDDARLLQCL